MKLSRMLGAAMVLSLGITTSTAALANDALIGAVVGGAAGALIGNTMGGDEGMIAGGALGAVAGAAIGHQSDRHARKREREWRDWHSRDYYPRHSGRRYSERYDDGYRGYAGYYDYDAPSAIYVDPPRHRHHRHHRHRDYRQMPVAIELY